MTTDGAQGAGSGRRILTIVLTIVALIVVALMVYNATKRTSVPYFPMISPAMGDTSFKTFMASCHSLLMGSDSYPGNGPYPVFQPNGNSVCVLHRQHLLLVELWLCGALLVVLFGLYLSTPRRDHRGPVPNPSMPNVS